MKAVRLIGAKNLKLVDEPEPRPMAKEVLLKIRAVGVCGSDRHRYLGATFEKEDPDYPIILGHEFAADIEKLGAEVKTRRVGERVAVEAGIHCGICEQCIKGFPNLCPNIQFCGVPPFDGALREYMAWPAHLVFPLPEKLGYDDGLMTEVLSICLHAINLCNFKPGSTAAVLGCGPIGLVTIQLLSRTLGAAQIIATEIRSYRLNHAKEMGATAVIDAEKDRVTESVMELTHGRGVDVVFEAAGVHDTCRQAVAICAPGGKVIFIGIPADDLTPFATAPARRKGLTFRFVRRSCLSYPKSIELLNAGLIDLSSLITHHFPIQRTKDAYDIVDTYSDGVIKAVVNPCEN